MVIELEIYLKEPDQPQYQSAEAALSGQDPVIDKVSTVRAVYTEVLLPPEAVAVGDIATALVTTVDLVAEAEPTLETTQAVVAEAPAVVAEALLAVHKVVPADLALLGKETTAVAEVVEDLLAREDRACLAV